jgi:hypothetical protein
VTLTDRDKKIVIALVPLLILVGYWFLLLAPKRDEASKAGDELTQQEAKRDQLQAEAARLKTAQADFASDYATVVKLGKAIPTSVDMPSLIVQLDSAARGTGISFEKVKAGERQAASGTGGSSSSGGSSSGSGTPASAPGGAPANTGPGQAAEKAGEAKQGADSRAGASGGTTSGSGSGGSSGGSQGSGVAGLDSVPLEFTFRGGFFDLTNFFHRLKRFVHVANNDRINVRGRLMVINGFTFKSTTFPRLEAQVFATVYLAPKTEGATAGATPGGPAAPSGGQSTPASGSSPAPSPSSGPPAAVSAR